MTILEALKKTTESIKSWAESKFLKKNEATADDFGVYVQDTAPADAVDGDIWIDTANDPTVIPVDYPTELPNPYAITFSGAASGSYDGTAAVYIDIPNAPVQSVNGQTGEVEVTVSSIGAQPAGDYALQSDLGDLATKDVVSKSDLASDVQTSLNKANSALQSYTETDPTVPTWAKQSVKPSYTASEVGADASGTAANKISAHNSDTTSHNDIRSNVQALTTKVNAIAVPTKLSQLTNDKGYITSYTETDPTVPAWAKASSKPTYTKSEVGLSNVDNVKQYSASNPPPYPVTSVNGKTGAVTISDLPAVTTADNGKVLMVVSGAWQVVDLNMSIDANGVVSI